MVPLRSQSGFSLVELSIVLVILGLLTGGILGGQSLIRAAELRSVSVDYSRYATATQTFRDKYFSLPGDFRDATRFWGYQGGSGCVSNAGITATTTNGTCDGDGSGIIFDGLAGNQTSEGFQFWRHLSLGGLIEGNYSGLAGTIGTVDHNFGVNSPRARISNAGWGSTYLDNSSGTTPGVLRYNYRNSLTLGGDDGAWADTQVLRPEEMWNIDTKLDDGRPHVGKIHAYPFGSGCSTATNNNDTAAEYGLSTNGINCTAIFRE